MTVYEIKQMGREGHDRVSRVLSFLARQWAMDGWGVAATLFGTAHPAAVSARRMSRTIGKLQADLTGKWSVEARRAERDGTGVWEDLYYRDEYRRIPSPGIPEWPAVKRASPRVLPRAFPSDEVQKQSVANFEWAAGWLGGLAGELAGVYGGHDSAALAAGKAAERAKKVAATLGKEGARHGT